MSNVYQESIRAFGCIPARVSLYLLCLSGIAVTGIIRSCTNFTILSMVIDRPPQEKTSNYTQKLCYQGYSNSTITGIDYGGTLDWSMDVQYYYLTAFFWSYILTQVLGGAAVQYCGTKLIFGLGVLIASISNLFLPFASNTHYILAIALQFLQGAAQGVTWPSIYGIVSSWIPIQERSRFLTCLQSLTLGYTMTQVVSGFIISGMGWQYVYYFSGLVGILWSLAWFSLVHNTPELHPRISKQELQYITVNRQHELKCNKLIPWKRIILSQPVWAIAITSFGRIWLGLTINIYGPMYLKTIVGLDAKMNGLFFSASSFCSFFAVFIFSCLADKLIFHKIKSLTFNRKLFTGIGTVVPGLLAIVLNYLNCNVVLILITLLSLQVMMTASCAGAMVNIVDISPSFAGPVSGLIQVILMSASVIATFVAKSFLKQNNPETAWNYIFNIAAAIIFSTYLVYAIFGSAKEQAWDNDAFGKNNRNDEDDEELKTFSK